jgi:nucleoside-diphosphate-sugar epimerase
MARYYSAKSGIPFVGLRFSNVFAEADYAGIDTFQHDARLRSWNAWGWVDTRDVAQSCRLALTADVTGADVFIIAAADTVMARSSRELLAEVFPDVPIHGDLDGRQTLLSIDKARRVLGYEPEHTFAARLTPNGEPS